MKKDTIIRPTNESTAPFDSTLKNNKRITAADSTRKESWRDFTNYFRLDFFSTFNALQFSNTRNSNTERDNFYFYYNVNIMNQFKTNLFSVQVNFFNELGYRKYIDSVSVKNEDVYYYKIDLSTQVYKSYQVNVSYQVKSQCWNTWNYMEDGNGEAKRLLSTSYFSPGYIMFSSGISHSFWKNCQWELGLVGGQITKIKNQRIFESTNEEQLFGIVKGKKRNVEFGLNFQLQVPARRIGKSVYWENSSRVFAKGGDVVEIKHYNIDFNNGFHFLFLKHLRLGLRTKINYDQTISEKIFMSNMVLFGFYLSNKL